ncbi:MAG TPA: ABC transporter ATP-binding protein, partial [Chloroflexota bacterium]|nr:ABC transporter ATP-binding protein [Chloroflexota bacterium]
LGISVLYITHDLTTAYHVSSQIVVLYRGSVMEVGDTETVVTDPQHPYTRLLIDSVPWPDPDRRWGQMELPSDEQVAARAAAGDRGCKFAARCPLATEVCYQAPPPLYQTNGAGEGGTTGTITANGTARRAVACYLWSEHTNGSAVTREAVPELLAGG